MWERWKECHVAAIVQVVYLVICVHEKKENTTMKPENNMVWFSFSRTTGYRKLLSDKDVLNWWQKAVTDQLVSQWIDEQD